MRENLLKIVAGSQEITHAVILTHNIDFVFLQSVVAPSLRKCGHPALTVFADAECATQSYAFQGRFLSGLGLRYRVVPVAMESGFRFHPKALLLSGARGATLLVGSGNLTFGGWCENGEVWIRYDTADSDSLGPIAAFKAYLHEVLSRTALNDSLVSGIEEAFDPNTRSWASELREADGLLGKAGTGGALLGRMVDLVGGRAVDELVVCSPYFDEDAEALREMSTSLKANRTTVLTQSGRTTLMRDAALRLDQRHSVKGISFLHEEKAKDDAETRRRETLVHAKVYAIRTEEEVLVFAGSANCSRAALTIGGSSGNAELLAVLSMSAAEFRAWFLDELEISDSLPDLARPGEDGTGDDEAGPHIRLLAARFDEGEVHRLHCERGSGGPTGRA